MYTLFSDFHIALIFYISIDDIYDYTMDYMENVARNFTKKYPPLPYHKFENHDLLQTDRMPHTLNSIL